MSNLGIRSASSQTSSDDESKTGLDTGIDNEVVDVDILLIREVQQRPLLWNKGTAEYKNQHKKELSWREIGKKVNVEGEL